MIQHRLVDIYIACESVRSLLYAAAIKNTEGSPDTLQSVAALKVKVGELGRSVAEDSVQLHGAIGFTDDCVVGMYYKRLIAIDTLFGNADIHLQTYIDSMVRNV